MKLDIEGAEYSFLNDKDNYSYLVDNVKYLLIEYHYINNIENGNSIKQSLQNDFEIIHERDRVIIFKNVTIHN